MDALPEQSASAQLAAYVAALDISDLPPHVVHEAKRALLDTVGAALAGTRADETDRVVAAVRDYDAASVATLWGRPERASVPAAALINGTAAHARELDDWLALVHAGAVVVPATLAMAEMVGASGARVIEATVAGYEVASRVSEAAGLAAQYRRGWHPTGTCGAFGAAAAAAKVIGLGADATTLALGLAGSFTGGIWAFIADGAMSKRLHPGKAAEVGVVAALLARRGFTGPRYVFEAPFGGFLSTYVPGEFDLAKLTEDLGRFKILENGYKPYACCRGIHAALDAALTLWHGARFAPDDVQSVRVAVPYEVYLMCGATRVDSLLDAQMSLAFSLGVALARGAVRLSDYERLPPEPAVQRLMQLVEVKVNDQLENEAAVVTIGLRDGRTLSERVDVGRGDSTTPLSDAELVAKFEELATRALPSSAIRASRDALLEAETLDSVVPLLRELARVVTV